MNTIDLTHAAWQKSSYSGGNKQNCVEVAENLAGAVAFRDSKHPSAGAHTVTLTTFRTFLTAVKHDRLSR